VRIPNGVDLPDNLAQHESGKVARRFLYLGRLSTNSRRDIPTLIRAFDRVAARHTDIELALVGNGDLFGDTLALVNACVARDRIQVPGFDTPNKWLSWADCFVLPSRTEGLSNALLEAMAAGLPCIANDIPPNREVLNNGEAGILVPVSDEDRLVEAMEKMASDPVHADLVRTAALKRVSSHYGIKSVAACHMALYEELRRTSRR
jgi:glycosyltransferase involved in cell wall biosynthesis